MEVASLGDVGSTVNVVVLHVEKDDIYMMGPIDIELYTHISEVMPKLVNIVLKSIYVLHDTHVIISYFVLVKRIL